MKNDACCTKNATKNAAVMPKGDLGRRRLLSAVFLGAVFVQAALASGCAVVEVKPWQRGVLAKPEMGGVPDPMAGKMRDHVYFSKEGASGGASAGGGGCGCN